MHRRAFITALGGAVAATGPWPGVTRAQQPTIGFLSPAAPEPDADHLRSFRRALKENGYSEGETVSIEFRWAEHRMDRLPALAADLVSRNVAVIAVAAQPAAFAAKAATTTIPIVFILSDDPVKLGLVASLARPGGNLTGVNFLNVELSAKRLELLRELVPGAVRIAALVNPANRNAESISREVAAAGSALGLEIHVHHAGTITEIDAAFATFRRERSDALFVGTDPFFHARRVQLAELAAQHGLPATYALRNYVQAGGLTSYGTSLNDAFRQVGEYCGRILKGAKPADLPVVQSSRFELVINLQSARKLGLTVSPSLLAIADEVIE